MIKIFNREPIYFVHIPKTAGTSIRKMLQRYYGEGNIFPNDTLLHSKFYGEYPDEKWLISNINKLPKYKALIGHWPLYIKNKLPGKQRTALFVRDPLQRTLSVLADATLRYKRSVKDLVNDQIYINDYIKNFQSRILGASNENDLKHGSDSELLGSILSQVEDISFIGITELFDDSCLLFDKTFGTKISLLQTKVNVLRPFKTELMEFTDQVQQWIEKDQILYEKIKLLFAKRMRNISL
jgi:hypothetical protein